MRPFLSRGCVIVTPSVDLDNGFARVAPLLVFFLAVEMLLPEVSSKSQNLILFIEAPRPNSFANQVLSASASSAPLPFLLKQRVPLEGAELKEHVAAPPLRRELIW